MRKKVIISLIMVMFVISLDIYKGSTDNSKLIGVYIDNEYVNTIPNKNDGYVVEKIVCDNDAVGEWDYKDWGLLLTNVKKKARCNIYFKKGIKLADTITLVDTTWKCPTVGSDGSVELTDTVVNDSALCMAPDAYGTSYYYRGLAINNYVYFAGFYWRIVRINGDGSIRMIYDGTSAHKNGEVSTDRQIGTSSYNGDDDNAYVGYMYGKINALNIEEAHTNTNDSIIKTYIDTWYEKNLKNTTNEHYLADNIFCNNRSISSKNTYKDTVYSNLGYGKNPTLYEWIDDDKKPNLICSVKNDSFSVNDISHGNGALTYPISLLSIDEYILANGNRSNNYNLYLTTGNWWWIFSAYYFDTGVRLQRVGPPGYLSLGDYAFHNDGVRPVINLKPQTLNYGDGSIDNPYRLENEIN